MARDPDLGERRFPTTQWSLVGRVGQDDPQARREALDRLLTCYLPALRAHLVYGRGLSPHDADDLLQEFVAGKVLERDILARADRQLGKFRTFLLTALERFRSNWMRGQRARRRTPGHGPPVQAGDRAEDIPAPDAPSASFDLAWARSVIAEAARRMEEECRSTGRAEVWGVFQSRVLRPSLEGAEPAEYQQLVERFGLQSPSQASNVLVTGKRMYVRALRSVVAEYAGDAAEIEAEIDQLREIVAATRR